MVAPLLITARITSPGWILPRALPVMSSISTPFLRSSSFFCSSLRSESTSPIRLGLPFSFAIGALRAARGASSSFSSVTVTAKSLAAPLRQTWSVIFAPGLTCVMMRGSSEDELTVLPSTLRMMSPGSTPAFSAGPPLSTELTSAPATLESPNASAVSLLTSWICTPMRPRVTRPFSWICLTALIATSIGIANASPM